MTMANKLDEKRLQHQESIGKEVLAAVEFELVGSIAHAGGILTGFSVKFGEVDTLMILRAVLAGKRQVAFVGAPDLSSCLRKAVGEAYSDGLKWKPDAYAGKED